MREMLLFLKCYILKQCEIKSVNSRYMSGLCYIGHRRNQQVGTIVREGGRRTKHDPAWGNRKRGERQ